MAAKSKVEKISFGPWSITAQKGPILSSSDSDRISHELSLPSVPEMLFGETFLQIDHNDGFSICFNALDALKLVDNKNDLMKVGVAEEWRKYRSDNEFIDDVVNPFDWTFTTNYMGTIKPTDRIKISSTEERIDLEKLRQREKINFYQDLLLFEDELADHGMVTLSVKIRVMPSSFFVLLRFFLRVDGVLIRMNDTRFYHEIGNNFILREYSSREKNIKDITNPHLDPSELADQLDRVSEIISKLEF